MNNLNKEEYTAPKIEMTEFAIENGFATSSGDYLDYPLEWGGLYDSNTDFE